MHSVTNLIQHIGRLPAGGFSLSGLDPRLGRYDPGVGRAGAHVLAAAEGAVAVAQGLRRGRWGAERLLAGLAL